MNNKYKKINIVKSLIFRYKDDEITAMGSQLAYSLLLSFFPFLILLMTIIGYTNIKSDDVIFSLLHILPLEVVNLIRDTILDIVGKRRSGLLSFSMISTIWTASNGFKAVIRGLNKAYDEKEKRPYWKVQLIALLCTIGLVSIIFLAFLLVIFGEIVVNYLTKRLNYTKSLQIMINIMRYLIFFSLMVFVFTAVYMYTPSKRLTFKETLPGSIFTTIGWTLISVIFSYYVNNFANYSKIYGSIGAIIALMSWLFISSIIILIGGEINATLSYRKLEINSEK
ncbi:membrane protein [Clostridium sp. USBA 49]|uniref:YihY/virulence factor BrkB family protein n=1 Tax=Clostridium TaxID=1485 RepID=UPI0009996B7E|nr:MULTISPECIES: YihY/virulence factor BrkB family protein [Clostridium]SKA73177.1 membrane protein [Clostridium sp. USBA 49]